jgi:hypothetical protein
MAQEISPRQVKYIKAMSRRVFGADDEAYREMLWRVVKVKSCRDCSRLKASLVIEHLEKCLGIRKAGQRDRRLHSRAPAPARPAAQARASARQVYEIRERWGRVSRAVDQEQALRHFLGRMRLPQAVEWLSLPQAQKVIEALKQMARRAGAGHAEG